MTWWQKTKNIIKNNKYLRSFFNEFIYGGHLIAIGLCGVVLLPAILLDVNVKPEFLLAIYLLSLGPCLFGRYVDLKKDSLTNPERSVHIGKKVTILPYVIAACAVVSVWILFASGNYGVMALGAAMIGLSFLYDLSLKKLTRKIIGFKNIFVGVLFSLLPVMMMLYHNAELSLAFWLIASYIFIMIVSGTAFSDIKDIRVDKADGLRTFAVLLGHKKLITLLILASFVANFLLIAGVYLSILPIYTIAIIVSFLYRIYLFVKSFDIKTNTKNDFIYSVLFDGELVLWAMLLFIGKVLTQWNI